MKRIIIMILILNGFCFCNASDLFTKKNDKLLYQGQLVNSIVINMNNEKTIDLSEYDIKNIKYNDKTIVFFRETDFYIVELYLDKISIIEYKPFSKMLYIYLH